MLLLAACESKNDDPQPIIDPVKTTHRVDYEVRWDTQNPDFKDTTFYVYNDAGQLIRIASQGGDALKDTSSYQYSFEYDNQGYLVKRKVKYPTNVPYSVDTFIKTGNLITINSMGLFGGNMWTDHYYQDNSGRITHIGDTAFAKKSNFTGFTWTDGNITEQNAYEWSGPQYYAQDKSIFTYDVSKKSPYYVTGIHWLKGTSFLYTREFEWLSTNVVIKEERINLALNKQAAWQFNWSYNNEGLPEMCTILGIEGGVPNESGNKRYIKFQYSKR